MMLRPTARLPLRSASQHLLRAGQRHQRRCISFAPPSKRPRTFKNTLARWGIAGAGIYAYANSELRLFARSANEEGYVGTEIYDVPQEAKLPTLEAIAESRQRRKASASAEVPSGSPSESHTDISSPTLPARQPSLSRDVQSAPAASPSAAPIAPSTEQSQSGPGALEEEASEEGAFNEETGEINWDCPCLGGMAHGPCGEQFRDAFSCFVYSKDEPKGVNCIDKFKTMQDCFRAHPDVYGAELTDDADPNEPLPEDAAISSSETGSAPAPTSSSASAPSSSDTIAPATAPYSGSTTPATSQSSDHNLTATPPSTPSSASSAAPTSTTPPAAAAAAGQTIAERTGPQDVHPDNISTGAPESAAGGSSSNTGTKIAELRSPQSEGNSDAVKEVEARRRRSKEARKQVESEHGREEGRSESEAVLPKEAHDAR